MTAPITPDERAEWRALADAATEGPWEETQNDLTDEIGVVHDQERRVEVAFTGMPHDKGAQADAEFIAAARTAVPRLLDALDTVEAERDKARYRAKATKDEVRRVDNFLRLERVAARQNLERAERAEAEVARLRAATSPVRPDREDIYRAWHGTDDPWAGCADSASIERVLDLWPGESRAQAEAAALRAAADAMDADPEVRDPLRLRSDWLRARADRIEKEK